MSDKQKLEGIELLRCAVRAFGDCREDFLHGWSAGELIAIYEVWRECEWDIYPDEWSERQVKEAIAGRVPQWLDEATPVHTDKLTPLQYQREIQRLALDAMQNAKEWSEDEDARRERCTTFVLEALDAHEYVTDESFHDDVLRLSRNSSAYFSEHGRIQLESLEHLPRIKAQCVFSAMQEDIQNVIAVRVRQAMQREAAQP